MRGQQGPAHYHRPGDRNVTLMDLVLALDYSLMRKKGLVLAMRPLKRADCLHVGSCTASMRVTHTLTVFGEPSYVEHFVSIW